MGIEETTLAGAILLFGFCYWLFVSLLGKSGRRPFVLIIMGTLFLLGSFYVNCAAPPTQATWVWDNPGTWIGWVVGNIGAFAGAVQLGEACIVVKILLMALSIIAFAFALWKVIFHG